MFEGVFSNPRPWVFGHLLLPGGSKSLGLPTHSLTSGSQAPLVGVLMQVGGKGGPVVGVFAWCVWGGREGGMEGRKEGGVSEREVVG